jgi:hypothetical protein
MQHLLTDFLCQTISRGDQNGGYDVVIAGKESLDYTEVWFRNDRWNFGIQFPKLMYKPNVDGTSVTAVREIDGEKKQ